MPEIKEGGTIRIKDNLETELKRIGFDDHTCRVMHSHYAGTEQPVLDVWTDEEGSKETYVTIALCVEIPLACCELI
jgi:hypothetical protein